MNIESYELPNQVLKLVPKPIVSIKTITYNHVDYIKQCLEGVLMQKTTFPIEFLIGEDYSTDGTRKIVFEYAKKYPDIIRVLTADKNIGVIANSLRLNKACRGKYIAVCEGDDYWIDPYKLQKQVDFLESNPDFGLVATDYTPVDENGNSLPDHKILIKQRQLYKPVFTFFDIIPSNRHFGTLTTCIRADLIKEIYKNKTQENLWFAYDYWLWLQIAVRSKIHKIDEITACYRRHSKGISRCGNFLNPRKKYYVQHDGLNTFMKLNKETLSGEQKRIIFQVASEIFFRRFGTQKMKWDLLRVMIVYYPGLEVHLKLARDSFKKRVKRVMSRMISNNRKRKD